MTLTMIDGVDAAERLGLPADPDEDVELRHARASFVAGVRYVVERYAEDCGRGEPGIARAEQADVGDALDQQQPVQADAEGKPAPAAQPGGGQPPNDGRRGIAGCLGGWRGGRDDTGVAAVDPRSRAGG